MNLWKWTHSMPYVAAYIHSSPQFPHFVVRYSDLVCTYCCGAAVSTVNIGAVQTLLVIGVNEITFTRVT